MPTFLLALLVLHVLAVLLLLFLFFFLLLFCFALRGGFLRFGGLRLSRGGLGV